MHDLDNSFQFFLGQFTSSLVQIDIGFLTNQVGVTTTNTLNGGQSVNDLDVTIDVGVQQTVIKLVNVFIRNIKSSTRFLLLAYITSKTFEKLLKTPLYIWRGLISVRFKHTAKCVGRNLVLEQLEKTSLPLFVIRSIQ